MSNNFLHANKYKQRALIFQGAGALGAYEAGVFREIYRKILWDQEEKGNNNQEEKGNNNINLLIS
jgi:hypothetical protein